MDQQVLDFLRQKKWAVYGVSANEKKALRPIKTKTMAMVVKSAFNCGSIVLRTFLF